MNLQRARGFVTMAAVLVVGLSAAWARATELPACGGHVTDTGHALTDQERSTLVADIDQLDVETLVDLAVWVTGASDDPLSTLGQRAYGVWRIGRVWDGGILVVVPTTGRAIVVQDAVHPLLAPAEVEQLTGADAPEEPMSRRLDAILDAARTVLRHKIDRHAPAHRLRYVSGSAALLLAAAALTARHRRRQAPGR